MGTGFCQKCKQSHPGRLCDYTDEGECAETAAVTPAQTNEAALEPAAPAQREGSGVAKKLR
jgi:hypothetical protein